MVKCSKLKITKCDLWTLWWAVGSHTYKKGGLPKHQMTFKIKSLVYEGPSLQVKFQGIDSQKSNEFHDKLIN